MQSGDVRRINGTRQKIIIKQQEHVAAGDTVKGARQRFRPGSVVAYSHGDNAGVRKSPVVADQVQRIWKIRPKAKKQLEKCRPEVGVSIVRQNHGRHIAN